MAGPFNAAAERTYSLLRTLDRRPAMCPGLFLLKDRRYPKRHHIVEPPTNDLEADWQAGHCWRILRKSTRNRECRALADKIEDRGDIKATVSPLFICYPELSVVGAFDPNGGERHGGTQESITMLQDRCQFLPGFRPFNLDRFELDRRHAKAAFQISEDPWIDFLPMIFDGMAKEGRKVDAPVLGPGIFEVSAPAQGHIDDLRSPRLQNGRGSPDRSFDLWIPDPAAETEA